MEGSNESGGNGKPKRKGRGAKRNSNPKFKAKSQNKMSESVVRKVQKLLKTDVEEEPTKKERFASNPVSKTRINTSALKTMMNRAKNDENEAE